MSRIETRQKIISNCAALFNQRGYQVLAIPTPELEKVSGQTKAVIYGYFDTKHAMALAVLDHNLTDKLGTMRQHLSSEERATAKLDLLIDLHDPFRENIFLPGGCPILNGAAASGHAGDEMRHLAAKVMLLWHQDLSTIIGDGVACGELRPTIDADDLAWQIISNIESALLVSFTVGDKRLGRKLLTHGKMLISQATLIHS